MDELTITKEKEQVFGVVKQFVSDIIGNEIAAELDITPESNFTKDLEMDSIELVSLAEKIRVEYGEKIDFVQWLSGMDLDRIIKLNISDIVDYIVNVNYSNK